MKNRLVIALFSAYILILSSGCQNQKSKTERLPFFGPRLGETRKMVKGKEVVDTVYHIIPEFKVINQDGIVVTQNDFTGKIYVADFFFTSCPSICPMTQANLLQVQKRFHNVDDFRMISFSIDPRHDNIQVLKDYATRLGANTKQWFFARGDEDKIYELAQKGYFATAMKDSSAPGGFLHSGAFILVDKDKRIRGVYNGTDTTEVSRLEKDIPRLFEEYHETINNAAE